MKGEGQLCIRCPSGVGHAVFHPTGWLWRALLLMQRFGRRPLEGGWPGGCACRTGWLSWPAAGQPERQAFATRG